MLLQSLGVFLECVLLPCAGTCFWPLGLKNPLVCKRTLVRKPLYTVCSLLSSYVSTSSIDKLKTRTLTLTLIVVDYNSSRNTYPRSNAAILLHVSSSVKTSLRHQEIRKWTSPTIFILHRPKNTKTSVAWSNFK
jgi:hypothetical protein